MPNINFNVPFLNEKGEPIMRIKTDATKIRIQPDGQARPAVCLQDDGLTAVQEVTMVKEPLAHILNMPFPGDDKVPFADKAKRGKLARKIQAEGEIHYTDAEVAIIRDLTEKSGTTVLLAQLDDLLIGEPLNKTAA